jgi:predicted aspartyl protease
MSVAAALVFCVAGGRAQEPSPPSLAPVAEPVVGGTALPLKVFADRCFVPVTLNGTIPCEAILDTGSEATLLNRARVEVKDLRPAGAVQLQGSHVGALGAESVMLDSLSLGACVLRNVPIGAIRHGKDQTLGMLDLILGMDVLRPRRFTCDFEKERFVLWEPKTELPKPGAGIERLRLPLGRSSSDPGTRPWVNGTVNGKLRALFLVDTGAGPVVLLNLKKPEECAVPLAGPPCAVVSANDGGHAKRLSLFRATLAKFELDRMVFENVPAEVLDASPVVGPLLRQELGCTYNVIGTAFLKTLKAVHFDLPGRALYLDRAAPGAEPEKAEVKAESKTPSEEGLRIGPRE